MMQLVFMLLVGLLIWRVVKRAQRVHWDAWRPVGRHLARDARVVLRKPVQQPPAPPNDFGPLTVWDIDWDKWEDENE